MLAWVILVLALLLIAAAFAMGWVMSDRYLVPKPYSLMPEFEITGVEDDGVEGDGYIVTLPVPEEPSQFSETGKGGIYNLIWEGGYGRLGAVLREDGDRVVRPVTGVVGAGPEAGDRARIDVAIYRRDPLQDHGIAFEELELDGEAGKLYAWWIDQGANRAVLALHGRRRADRSETSRILPTLVEADWSVLALAYRNHDRSEASPDGLYHYGASEAEDALTALEVLARRGVGEVVLYGFSMGGAVALEAARRWPDEGPRLVGIVLDSPLLDPRTVIRKGARDAGLPAPALIADISFVVARLRTGVVWASLDQRRWAPDIEVPVLLIAGTADATIPIELVDEFAARVRAPLDYLRLDGVEHVEGWNRARGRYEASVRGFLDSLSGRGD